ncbi:unnamed protein product [Medioppia subpectinata]|uniref:Uncharacterized protein n=1 Tax=Medioppia subpectinata TaxID=1979941 RepID=A0A7R9LYT1_9ACAR|nr:unnamed protein product [Medioppia subpectinata]CAG2122913.1 unnamed protein product [Medioppia subpectinata]
MIKKLEQQRQELDERRKAYQKDLEAFELISKDMEEIRRVNTMDSTMRSMCL